MSQCICVRVCVSNFTRPHVNICVLIEADEPSSSAIMAVLSSEDGPRVVRAPGVCLEEARAALAACAAAYCRTGVTTPPQQAIDALRGCTLPLYAKVGYELRN